MAIIRMKKDSDKFLNFGITWSRFCLLAIVQDQKFLRAMPKWENNVERRSNERKFLRLAGSASLRVASLYCQ